MQHIMTHNTIDNLSTAQPRSLNAAVRKRELRRIMDENQASARAHRRAPTVRTAAPPQKILQRIQSQKPFCDRRKWREHEVQHEQMVRTHQEVKPPRRPATRSQSTDILASARAVRSRQRGELARGPPTPARGSPTGDQSVVKSARRRPSVCC
jgi:hypothetical protein